MKKLLFISLSAIIISCSNAPSNNKNDSSETTSNSDKYEIINEETSAAAATAEEIIKLNKSGIKNKCILDVKLNEKPDKDILQDIVTKLRKDRMNYEILFISFYLSDKKGSPIWATATFSPDLGNSIQIIGSTNIQDEQTTAIDKQSISSTDGEIIGMWQMENSNLISMFIAYKDHGQLMMKTVFKPGNGEPMLEKIKERKKEDKKIYDPNNSNGEYYVLENNGNLGLYDKDGKYDEAKKIN